LELSKEDLERIGEELDNGRAAVCSLAAETIEWFQIRKLSRLPVEQQVDGSDVNHGLPLAFPSPHP
jgi:hypothetical protein